LLLELGVCSTEHYANRAKVPGPRSRDPRFAYTLLRTSSPASPAELERFEDVLQDLGHSTGVYRTTTARRFESLDLFLMPILQARFPRDAPLVAEDWAASACITSAEWFQLLQQSFPNARVTASDLYLHLAEIVLPGGRESFIVEPGGQPLQYIRPPFVIPLSQRESAWLPVNRWLQARAMKRFERLKLDETGESSRKISLIHPTALALTRSCQAFRIEEHSIFELRPELCDAIRTMNILNCIYFDATRLTECMRAVWRSLHVHGLWVVGRTFEERKASTPARNHASVLEKTPEGFRLVGRHGAASEVEDLALALRM